MYSSRFSLPNLLSVVLNVNFYFITCMILTSLPNTNMATACNIKKTLFGYDSRKRSEMRLKALEEPHEITLAFLACTKQHKTFIRWGDCSSRAALSYGPFFFFHFKLFTSAKEKGHELKWKKLKWCRNIQYGPIKRG